MMAINMAAKSAVTSPSKSAVPSTTKAPEQDSKKSDQQQSVREERSEYEQALSRVSKHNEEKAVTTKKDEEKAAATKLDSEKETEKKDNPLVVESTQPGIMPPPVHSSGEILTGVGHHNTSTGLQSDGNFLAGRLTNLTSFSTQSLKQTAQPMAETRLHYVGTALNSAFAQSMHPAHMVEGTATAKAAMALTTNMAIKNSMPLTLEGALVNAHHVKNTLDVASLRVEQQVGDVTLAERQAMQSAPAKYEWAMVKLDNQQQNWSRQLYSVLQDRIEMQIHQQVKQATVRLDPPDLGRLDLSVHFDGDRLSVVINAGNASVRDALQASIGQLRDTLSNQFGAGVDVNVGGDSGSKQFKESENNVALHSVEEQETIESVMSHTSGWLV